MKRKDFLKEIRSKSIVELRKMEQEVRKEIIKLRMDKLSGKLAKPNILKEARKKLARILTIIKEKEKEQ